MNLNIIPDADIEGNAAKEKCLNARVSRIALILNIVFAILIAALIFGLTKLQDAEISNIKNINTVLIVALIISVIGIVLTNVITGIIRKILFIKFAITEIKNSGRDLLSK